MFKINAIHLLRKRTLLFSILAVIFLVACNQVKQVGDTQLDQSKIEVLPEKTLSIIDTMIVFDTETYTETITIKEHELKLFAIIDTVYTKQQGNEKPSKQITEFYGDPGLTKADLKRMEISILDTMVVFDPQKNTETIIIRKYQKVISK